MRSLLQGLFDFAGLFPPARLGMETAVAGYLQHAQSSEAWMLNRFVVTASRLEEFAAVWNAEGRRTGSTELTVVSTNWLEDRPLVKSFQDRGDPTCQVTSIETKELAVLEDPDLHLDVYLEIPLSADPTTLLARLNGERQFAKMRTGGLTQETFPTPDAVAEFLVSCHAARVAFKATAGLHHPVAGQRPASCDADAPLVEMHGFVNVLLAAVAAQREEGKSQLVELLVAGEDDIRIEADGVHCGNWSCTAADIQQTRHSSFHSIGSCSFDEPVEDLTQLGWLPQH